MVYEYRLKLEHVSDSGFDGFFKLVKPTNLAAPTCLAIMNPNARQNRFFFLAEVHGLLAAYSGSCSLSSLLTLALAQSENARLPGLASSLRKEWAFPMERRPITCWEMSKSFLSAY